MRYYSRLYLVDGGGGGYSADSNETERAIIYTSSITLYFIAFIIELTV